MEPLGVVVKIAPESGAADVSPASRRTEKPAKARPAMTARAGKRSQGRGLRWPCSSSTTSHSQPYSRALRRPTRRGMCDLLWDCHAVSGGGDDYGKYHGSTG